MQSCLVNVDPSLVGLFCSLNVHVAKHGSDALSHAVIALSRSTPASFAITRYNINGFYGLKFWGICQIRHKTFF
jgi:hypothetical protein